MIRVMLIGMGTSLPAISVLINMDGFGYDRKQENYR